MSRREWNKTARIVEEAREILSAEFPMTLRQCFYRLVSREVIQNSRRDYQMLSRILTKARNDGRVDFGWLVDRSRLVYSPCVFENPQRYAETISRAYRKDYWNSQPNYVEVWTEKDSIIGSIEPVTDELGVTVRVGRGFLSTTRAHEIAEYFNSKDKDIIVFYLGDFDPSGVAIEDDAASRIRAHGAYFEIERLAIHRSDISAFDLPPLRVKDSDTRSTAFKRQNGDQCVELEALPVGELRDRIRKAVSNLIDYDLWDRAVAVEKIELASILDSMKHLAGAYRGSWQCVMSKASRIGMSALSAPHDVTVEVCPVSGKNKYLTKEAAERVAASPIGLQALRCLIVHLPALSL